MDARMRGFALGIVCGACLLLAACQGPDSNTSAGRMTRPPARQEEKRSPTEWAAEPDVRPRTHLAAGRMHESQNHVNRAVEQYRAAVALDPKLVDAHDRLAVCLTQLGQYSEAETHFVKAVDLAPTRAHLRNNLAFCYLSQRRWADAEAELRKALELKPDFARARVNLGMVLAQQQRFDAALQAFRLALKEQDAQFNMGLMYQSLNRYANAGEAFRKALLVNPRFVAAQERLDKLQPMLPKPAPERPREHVAAPASQPAPAVARAPDAGLPRPHAKPPKGPAAKGKAANVAVQSSPRPLVLPDIMPAARKAFGAIKDAMVYLAAVSLENERLSSDFVGPPAEVVGPAETPARFVVECDVPVDPPAVPFDLDVQDNLWLDQLDPSRTFDQAERVRMLDDAEDAS